VIHLRHHLFSLLCTFQGLKPKTGGMWDHKTGFPSRRLSQFLSSAVLWLFFRIERYFKAVDVTFSTFSFIVLQDYLSLSLHNAIIHFHLSLGGTSASTPKMIIYETFPLSLLFTQKTVLIDERNG
jgi:hypothetical protein